MPLADTARAAAENHDFLALARLGLALGFIRAVEVRREALEFGRAGIHAIEHGSNAERFALLADRERRGLPDAGPSVEIGDAVALGFAERTGVDGFERHRGEVLFELHHFVNLREEPAVRWP